MTDVLMTSIVLKTNVTLLDIVSTRMLGQFGFLSKVRPPAGLREHAHEFLAPLLPSNAK